MPTYFYKAITQNGNTVSGSIEADTMEHATGSLLSRGYIPSVVTDKRKGGISNLTSRLVVKLTPVKSDELIIFTKQLRTLVRAGVPMLKLLQVLENQTENIRLKKTILSMSQDIKEGASLNDAFKKHPSTFSPLYCSMLNAGEASGSLPETLLRLIYLIEHEHKIKSEIKATLFYPAIVIFALFAAFFILLVFVIPKFVDIFIKSGLELPLPTIICMNLYSFLSAFWPVILISGLILFILLYFYLKTKRGKLARDYFMLKLPFAGGLIQKGAMARFAGVFSILQSSGIGVLEAMKILSNTINNKAMAKEFDLINERLEEGHGIAGPLKSARFFTPIIINMVAIGEEAGNLDEMLREAADHYDSELEFAMKKMSDAIGPMLTVCLAAVVLFFALAVYLPMWDLAQMVR